MEKQRIAEKHNNAENSFFNFDEKLGKSEMIYK